MCSESKPIPTGEQTQEVAVRLIDGGQVELVLVDHEGRREVVPVALQPVACAKRAAA
jgi:hypothetical protein